MKRFGSPCSREGASETKENAPQPLCLPPPTPTASLSLVGNVVGFFFMVTVLSCFSIERFMRIFFVVVCDFIYTKAVLFLLFLLYVFKLNQTI